MDDHYIKIKSDFFETISTEEQIQLFKIGKKCRFEKDGMVFQAGSASDDVYILLDGRVKIFELSADGKEVILWFCFTGELFGLAEVLCREHREVNAQACSTVELLTIKHADFQHFLLAHPSAALRVIELLSGRLRELGDMLLNLASDDVSSRVMKLITRLAARYGRAHGDGVYLDIPLTHQEMADMIGTSRQTVTTVLGGLKKKGILRTEQRTIFIQNVDWIQCMSEYGVVKISPQRTNRAGDNVNKRKLCVVSR